MSEKRLKIQHQAYELYEQGYRSSWIAEKLGIKPASVRTFVSNERRLLGIEPQKRNNLPKRVAKAKPVSKKLVSFAGRAKDQRDEWQHIGDVAQKVVGGL